MLTTVITNKLPIKTNRFFQHFYCYCLSTESSFCLSKNELSFSTLLWPIKRIVQHLYCYCLSNTIAYQSNCLFVFNTTNTSSSVDEQRKIYRPPANNKGVFMEKNLLSMGDWVLLGSCADTVEKSAGGCWLGLVWDVWEWEWVCLGRLGVCGSAFGSEWLFFGRFWTCFLCSIC